MPLEYGVEGGGMFTAGQLRLLCVAQALLRNSRVLIIEESDERVDVEAENIFQKTIRTQFIDTTIICLTPHIRSIIDYDRVAVIEKGVLVECDNPATLLADKASNFYGLCEMSGEFERLKMLAGHKEYVMEEVRASSCF